jgi:hypothetical protein
VAASSTTEPVAAAKPARTVLASADPDQPIPAPAAPAESKPFNSRMMGAVLGGKPEAAAPATAAAQLPTSQDTAPQPPRRKPLTAAKKAEAKPSANVRPGEKSASEAPQKHVQAGFIPGAAPIGPLATAFRTN